MACLTRRDLFKGTFSAEKPAASTDANAPSSLAERTPLSWNELEAIAGDFPPEMLSMEAKRLGLDPDSPDRETLLAAVYRAMTGSGPEKSGL